jgi:hypothetical protein
MNNKCGLISKNQLNDLNVSINVVTQTFHLNNYFRILYGAH